MFSHLHFHHDINRFMKYGWKIYLFLCLCFLLLILSMHRTAGEGRGHLYCSLQLAPAHKHSNTYLQVCNWNGYHIFLITAHVITRLLLYEIEPILRISMLIVSNCIFMMLISMLDLFGIIFHRWAVDLNLHWLFKAINLRRKCFVSSSETLTTRWWKIYPKRFQTI